MSIARIQEKELAALREKAKAHDAYLEACRVMGGRQYGMLQRRSLGGTRYLADSPDYVDGWLSCLKEFSQAVADAGKELE